MIENIDLSKSKEYILSIRLSSDGFSFSVVNPLRDSDFMFSRFDVSSSTSISANLKEWIQATAELKLDYKKVNIIFDSLRFMAVPSELYDERKREEIFYYNYSKINNEKVLRDTILKDNISILYGVDKYSLQIIEDNFVNPELVCSLTPLAHYYSEKSRFGNNRKVFVQLREHGIELFCFDKNKLLLLNTYQCRQNSDRMYFIMYVWNQIGCNVEKDELIINGNVKGKEELLKELKRFIPQAYLLLPKAEFNRSPLAQIEYLPFDMQTLLLCE